MTRLHTLHENASLLQKNTSPSTTSTPHQTLLNQSSLLSSLLSPHQPLTHLEFPHLNSPKPVPASQPHHFVSDVTASRTHARRSLQHLFRPYLKPTPYPHLYLCLHLTIRSDRGSIRQLTCSSAANTNRRSGATTTSSSAALPPSTSHDGSRTDHANSCHPHQWPCIPH